MNAPRAHSTYWYSNESILCASAQFIAMGNTLETSTMTIHSSPVHISQYPLYRDVLLTLRTLTPRPSRGQIIPSPDVWATTRQISDAHDISIYKARLLLLDLVKLGLVIVSDGPVNNSLRWFPQDYPNSGTQTATPPSFL
ncbi:hypothetical protein [Serratia nematodiphila]|uniref:hypothetical protein n=1 Tax=Serratia nematodiphila TaxID=458197 RepID=UPI0011D9642C|nr:hypothetical protein [Serratia nematodiphila]TXE66632.1 hypothetical protein FOT58_02390 [Serratia nematodiphila]